MTIKKGFFLLKQNYSLCSHHKVPKGPVTDRIFMMLIHPSGAPREFKKHAELFCVSQVWLDVYLAPSAMHPIKLLPVKELHNNMTNVSKVIHHLYVTVIF